MLGPDAAHDDLGDALLGEQLLEVGGGERVCEVLVSCGSPACGLSGPMWRAWPLAGRMWSPIQARDAGRIPQTGGGLCQGRPARL